VDPDGMQGKEAKDKGKKVNTEENIVRLYIPLHEEDIFLRETPLIITMQLKVTTTTYKNKKGEKSTTTTVSSQPNEILVTKDDNYSTSINFSAFDENGNFSLMVGVSEGNYSETYSSNIGQEIGAEIKGVGVSSSSNGGRSRTQEKEGGAAAFIWDFNIQIDETGALKTSWLESEQQNRAAIKKLNKLDISEDIIGGSEYKWGKPLFQLVKKIK
jgi:hypothetical protein